MVFLLITYARRKVMNKKCPYILIGGENLAILEQLGTVPFYCLTPLHNP